MLTTGFRVRMAVAMVVVLLFSTPIAASASTSPSVLGSIAGNGIIEVRGVHVTGESTVFVGDAIQTGNRSYAKLALVDGNKAPRLRCECRTLVPGDARCLSIAAASIVAKVTRDRLMVALGREWPQYGFERHKGYGTREHQQALAAHGACLHHRRSFEPVQLALGLV